MMCVHSCAPPLMFRVVSCVEPSVLYTHIQHIHIRFTTALKRKKTRQFLHAGAPRKKHHKRAAATPTQKVKKVARWYWGGRMSVCNLRVGKECISIPSRTRGGRFSPIVSVQYSRTLAISCGFQTKVRKSKLDTRITESGLMSRLRVTQSINSSII